jgi:hypothetical protein
MYSLHCVTGNDNKAVDGGLTSCDAVWACKWLPTFGRTYCFHLQDFSWLQFQENVTEGNFIGNVSTSTPCCKSACYWEEVCEMAYRRASLSLLLKITKRLALFF